MSNQSYSLEIISHHPTFKSKSLRKYYVEGIETVGAWGDEPFEIKFTNYTWQKVEVKLSVDGTDVLSGDPATTDATAKMWVVNGYGTLSLKAWPENNNGGAQFVFTSGNNSVAAHTHGDMSSRGIIAAAVYTEGHVEPARINHNFYYTGYPIHRRSIVDYSAYPSWGSNTIGGDLIGGVTYGTNTTTTVCSAGGAGATMDSLSFNACDVAAASGETPVTKSLESLVAVGAGQHVDQKITYVAGLIKPTFSETIRVKYMWWDELVAKLREHNVPAPQPSGFPADQKRANINLGGTPRIGTYAGNAFPRTKQSEPYQSYMRV